MKDADKLDYAKTYLRRTKSLAEIRSLADRVGAALMAGKTKVAITSSSMEGGSSAGVIEWECALTGQACEALIRELDPDYVPPPLRVISHTVAMGPGYCIQ